MFGRTRTQQVQFARGGKQRVLFALFVVELFVEQAFAHAERGDHDLGAVCRRARPVRAPANRKRATGAALRQSFRSATAFPDRRDATGSKIPSPPPPESNSHASHGADSRSATCEAAQSRARCRRPHRSAGLRARFKISSSLSFSRTIFSADFSERDDMSASDKRAERHGDACADIAPFTSINSSEPPPRSPITPSTWLEPDSTPKAANFASR